MELILALLAIHCNNNFNYKGCVDRKVECIENHVAAKLNKPGWSIYEKPMARSNEPQVIAEGYYICTHDSDAYYCRE